MVNFRLSQAFLERYVGKQPDWGPLGLFTYKRTYARPLPEENRTEEWWETVQRVVEGCYSIQKQHCEQLRLPWNGQKAQHSAQEMYSLIFDFKFLPPGRGLWMMGTPYIQERGSAALFNCGFVSTKEINLNFSDPFCFLMDMSMLGVGVGGDTKGAGTFKVKQPRIGHSTLVVEDSREGWVELVRTILDAYAGRGSIPAEVDYSHVRPYGAPIKSFGGTASGPDPLIELVSKDIPSILDPLIDSEITSSAIVDVFNAIARCVVSGNVRRSATVMLGDITDEEYLSLKDPSKHKKMVEKWRWASNNSVFASVGDDYSSVVEKTFKNGEPGYFWLDTARSFGRLVDPSTDKDSQIEGVNPCGEIGLESEELCNVVETFPARHSSYAEYERTNKFAYLYAKTVALLPSHNDRTNAVMLRNRRIGISQSGISQAITKHGVREYFKWCNQAYAYIQNLDKTYSGWLCVPQSKKTTTVKPSGTVSLLAGATPGIHFPRAEYYWRAVRHDAESELTKTFKEAGYRVEKGEGHNTAVIYFPVKEQGFSKSLEQMTIWEQMEMTAQMQYWWADNQVSATISFKKEEKKDLLLALQFYETRLKSISFLPYLSTEEMREMGYTHPPIQPMLKEEYLEAVKKLKPVNEILGTETKGFEKVFCEGDTCMLPKK